MCGTEVGAGLRRGGFRRFTVVTVSFIALINHSLTRLVHMWRASGRQVSRLSTVEAYDSVVREGKFTIHLAVPA
ncbi:hypothetical protein EGR_04117 [Echinococcus granulosus]|uniref:Uncharacterized protein n=1 Tax=Echinococcus granulosus TaxID=6210 RepID=W6V4K3_ECHGR|nr:hypothetical protein EGR_04117 [Echinococcus granulosus]EUB61084.1 hypothetical protein EGR_04117 [Echinococcus granulosus]